MNGDRSGQPRRTLPAAWILGGILVLAASLVMVRLGFWQFDRLAQRRAFNARVSSQINAEVLDMNQSPLPGNLEDMEYRKVQVRGTYDFAHQVELRNQPRTGELGVHLLTPLVIEGSQQKVLVDRGWVPHERAAASRVGQFDEPGVVTVNGILQRSKAAPGGLLGASSDPVVVGRLPGWISVDIDTIAELTGVDLLPVYIAAGPVGGDENGLPVRSEPEVSLTEGSHLAYAIQWFIFASALPVGFFLVMRQRGQRARRGNPQVEVEERPGYSG